MRKRRKEYSYQINLIPEEEGGYTVVVPLLPGCISYGGTIEEATANVREAIELHSEDHSSAHPGDARAGLSKSEIARRLEIGRTSVRRILKERSHP